MSDKNTEDIVENSYITELDEEGSVITPDIIRLALRLLEAQTTLALYKAQEIYGQICASVVFKLRIKE